MFVIKYFIVFAITCCLLLFLCCTAILYISPFTLETKIIPPKQQLAYVLRPDVREKQYYLLDQLIPTFQRKDIVFWPIGSTLQNTLCWSDITWWQDTITFAVHQQQLSVLLSLTYEFDFRCKWKFHKHGFSLSYNNWQSFPKIDILLLTEYDGQMIPCTPTNLVGDCLYNDIQHYRSLPTLDIVPFQKHTFGKYQVSIPAKSDHCLLQFFGPQWKTDYQVNDPIWNRLTMDWWNRMKSLYPF